MLRFFLAAILWPIVFVRAVAGVALDERTIFDPARHRNIPVLIYSTNRHSQRPLVILSHGKGIKNSEYSFIASSLAEKGYIVLSIQHDLPGDPPVPNTGNIPKDRSPGWRAQVQSIMRVMSAFDRLREFRFKGKPILIGHSNGGDATMMAARDYPNKFSVAMSLDNRRFALPRTAKPQICSLRSSDQRADPGVLPMTNEEAEFSMRIMQARGLRHDDMWDGATEMQKAQMLAAVYACLAP